MNMNFDEGETLLKADKRVYNTLPTLTLTRIFDEVYPTNSNHAVGSTVRGTCLFLAYFIL